AHAERQPIRPPGLGGDGIGALAAAVRVAGRLGVPLARIAEAVAPVPPYPGRMQVVRLPGGAVVIRDECKGSPHTVQAAFTELRKARAERKFLAFRSEEHTSELQSRENAV